MQRLVSRIQDEFSILKASTVEINVLNGSGEYMVIFTGHVKDVTIYSLKNYFHQPGCFYFVNIVSTSPLRNERGYRHRELCWLSDPIAPEVSLSGNNSFCVSWEPAQFCGFKPYSVLDSIVYTIEIKEGVPWKEGYASQYVNDINNNAYKRVFSSKDTYSFDITELRASCWYHIRLEIEYLGIKVYSEVQSAHTIRGIPSAPGMPRITVIPVANSFDVNSHVPSRFDILITWNMSVPNGADIISYQLQLKSFDQTGAPKAMKRLTSGHDQFRKSESDAITKIISTKKNYNQWIQSRGRDFKQVENCLRHRASSPKGDRILPSISNDDLQQQNSQESLFASPFGMDNNLTGGESYNSDANNENVHDRRNTGWVILYNNLNRRLKLDPPKSNVSAWNIRIRSRNAVGWSPFSEILVVNGLTHPSLFHLPSLSYNVLPSESVFKDKMRPLSSPARYSNPLVLPSTKKNKLLLPPPIEVKDDDYNNELWMMDPQLEEVFSDENAHKGKHNSNPPLVSLPHNDLPHQTSSTTTAATKGSKAGFRINFASKINKNDHQTASARGLQKHSPVGSQSTGNDLHPPNYHSTTSSTAAHHHLVDSSTSSIPHSEINKTTPSSASKSSLHAHNLATSHSKLHKQGSTNSSEALPMETSPPPVRIRRNSMTGTHKILNILLPFNDWD
mmetsp:Transcript_30988/g.44521  ORF Transcript_30988/g.44521 Transcript_30988/m.44521 type:complete len:675 (+) Transcript_30988:854-2878(+)